MDCILRPGMRVLLVAIGGGGDVASTAVLKRSLKDINVDCILASIAWERYVYDPLPGPVRLSEIRNYVDSGEYYVAITGESYAIRGEKKLVFQAAKVARLLGEKMYIIDLYGGVEGYTRALEEITLKDGLDLVIGVDVGGDSLATGCEEDLWSPLADWMGLAALSRVRGILAVHSPGSDGELDQEYLLERIDNYARKGGLLAVRSMCARDAKFLEEVLKDINSEASAIPLMAYRGVRGDVELRKGSRRVKVTLLNTFTFFLDAFMVVNSIEPVKGLRYTKSLEEAVKLVNSYGIYTELNLEEDLAKLGVKPEEITGGLLIEVRKRGITRVKSSAMIKYCS
ncbi:MAG: DUF1152 domain-containing protein [Desulfurococcaceae archaeon]